VYFLNPDPVTCPVLNCSIVNEDRSPRAVSADFWVDSQQLHLRNNSTSEYEASFFILCQTKLASVMSEKVSLSARFAAPSSPFFVVIAPEFSETLKS
jgi:hypothetical protein